MKKLCMKICSITLVFIMLFSSIGFFNPMLEVYGSTETIQLPAGAVITDTVMHPSQPIMYAVDNANSKVYAINYETNTYTEASFDLIKPERVEFSNGQLYVTLLKIAAHTHDTNSALQTGAVQIMNPDLTLVKRIDVNVDPFDIAVSGDILYIPSGSGQWTNIMSYSESSGAMIASKAIRHQSYVEINTQLNKIYSITTDSSPRDYEAYDVNNGVFGTNSYDTPYHGDYAMNKNFRLSPDGNYLFNGSGLILSCNANGNINDSITRDMLFSYMLDKPFNDIAFDTENNMFYTAITGKMIYSYDYNNYNKGNTYSSQGEVSQLYYRGSTLIALSKTDAGQYFVEKINVSGNTTVLPVLANKQLVNDGIKLEMDYIVQDSVLHPTNPIMFIADAEHSKIAAINYNTGGVTEVSTSFSPGSIAYYNNKLLVGYGNQGKIDIYDPVTMQLLDVVYTRDIFFDMTVGRDGNIYINAEEYTRGYSITTKQELSKTRVSQQGYLEVHPIRNSLFLTSMNVSPMDLYVVNYSTDGSGNLVMTHYNSPYHGTYTLKANNKISPDGRYIFNGSGNIFTLTDVPDTNVPTTDMTYFNRLDSVFKDAEFNQGGTRIYTGVPGNAIKAYDYSTLQGLGAYDTLGLVTKLHRAGNELIAVEQTSSTASVIEVYNLTLPIECYNKVRALETAVAADLTLSTNLEAAEGAVAVANEVLAAVTDEAAKAGLVARATVAQTKLEKAKTAIAAVMDLETKAGYDLRIEANLMAAEAAVPVANAAVVEVAASATRTTLNSRLAAVTAAVTTARAAYDAAVAAATAKVEALETAAATNLTMLSNLTAAETAVAQATTAVNELGAGTAKTELLPRVNTATTTVKTARIAYATIKVEALETAAAADLTELSNLTAAETAVTQATTEVNIIDAGTEKTALLARINAATTTVTTARTAYNVAAATAKVEALETAAAADLTILSNLTAAEAAVTQANTAVNALGAGTTKTSLLARVNTATTTVTTARAAYNAVPSATAKVVTLETAAAANLTILSNLTAAEAAVVQANTAVNALAAGTTKTSLQARVNTAATTITTARAAYNAAVAAATSKVVALETAVATNLTVLNNLTAAEAAVVQASTAVNALGASTTKTALLARVNTATATVTTARTAYDAATSTTPPITQPVTPPPVVVPTSPTTDTNITQGANTVNDAANGTQPINDTTTLNNAVNQAVAALNNTDESKQAANISVITDQIIAKASDIAAKVTDAASKEGFITTATNAITAVVEAAATVNTEENAIELAESFKTISQEITTLSIITTNAETQQQLAAQQVKLTDTMQTVAENVIANTGTVKAVATNLYGNVTVSLNQQAITDLLAKVDKVVAAANSLNTAMASSGINVTVEKKIVLEVTASTGAKTVNAELPSTILEQMQSKGIESVEIESGVAKITVEPDFITKAANTQTIALEVQKVALTDDLINSMNEQQKTLIQGASEIYDFNAILRDSSNIETQVTNFNNNIEISLPYSLKPGENKENITILYLADDGTVKNMAGVYDEVTGTVTFLTNHFSKYLIKNNIVKFSDVAESNWAKKEIEAMASKGIVSGNQGKFLPNNNITRAEFAKLITTALNIVDDNATTYLKDVDKNAWYYKYVASAVKAGVISGKSDGTFDPNAAISRQDMAIMLSNAMTKVKGAPSVAAASSYINSFEDKDSITGYAIEEVATAIKYKLMAGKPGNKVDSLGKVTKAEAAAVIYRLFNM